MRGPSRVDVVWQRPLVGVIKLNCDAAFSSKGEKHGFGFIARNSCGNFVVAGSKTLWVVGSAEYVEA